MRQIRLLKEWFSSLLVKHGKNIFSTFRSYDKENDLLVLEKKIFTIRYGLFWIDDFPADNQLIVSWATCFEHPLIWNIDVISYLSSSFKFPLCLDKDDYPFYPIPKAPPVWMLNQAGWSFEEAFARKKWEFDFHRLPPSRFGLAEKLYYQNISYSKSLYQMIEQGDWPLILAGERRWPWKDASFTARCFCLFLDKGMKSITDPSKIEDDIRMMDVFFSHQVDVYFNVPYQKEKGTETIHYSQTPLERFSKHINLHPHLQKKMLDYAPSIPVKELQREEKSSFVSMIAEDFIPEKKIKTKEMLFYWAMIASPVLLAVTYFIW